MGIYRNISMPQRLDKIGELLAKGVYLCLKKEEKRAIKENDEGNTRNNKAMPAEAPKNIS